MEMAMCMNHIEPAVSQQSEQKSWHERVVQGQKGSGKSANLHAIDEFSLGHPWHSGRVYNYLMPGFNKLPAESLDMKLDATHMGRIERCDLQDSQARASVASIGAGIVSAQNVKPGVSDSATAQLLKTTHPLPLKREDE
jgi:hypothetical protein